MCGTPNSSRSTSTFSDANATAIVRKRKTVRCIGSESVAVPHDSNHSRHGVRVGCEITVSPKVALVAVFSALGPDEAMRAPQEIRRVHLPDVGILVGSEWRGTRV